ncbi:MAG: leucine-rich repeat domain-containing protein, partial [Clostridia bacterium]|nr:leucine-rich repeat domain-containing protein [Clostridia bacterium]
ALAHNFKDNVCTRCFDYSPDIQVTEGLEYAPYKDGVMVIGPGSVTAHDAFARDINLVIPAMHEGKPVLGIRGDALYSCHEFVSVLIPNTVEFIGNGAFHGSRKLVKVVLPESLLKIESNAFQNTYITSIHIPKNVNEIGVGVFESCPLESITVASDNPYFSGKGNCIVEKSTKTLIAGCQNTVIPDDGSVTSIGDRAFERQSRLSSIYIPYGVTSIGNLAFDNVNSLKTVTIPNTLTSIGNQAFGYCNMLSTVNYLGTAAERNTINFGSNNDKLTGANWNYAATGLEYAEIKEGNTVVAYSVLLKGTAVFSDTLIIPTTHNGLPVTKIVRDDSAGKIYDTPVKTIIIPHGITTICDYAFLNFHSLTTVIIADSVTSIGGYAFENCEKLTTVLMGGGVREIGEMAFAQCNALTSITLPKTLTKIGTFVFQQTNITTVYYEGTQTDWDEITFDTVLISSGEITGNEGWLDKIVYNS